MPSLEIQMNQEQCNMTFIVLLAAWLPSSVKEDVKIIGHRNTSLTNCIRMWYIEFYMCCCFPLQSLSSIGGTSETQLMSGIMRDISFRTGHMCVCPVCRKRKYYRVLSGLQGQKTSMASVKCFHKHLRSWVVIRKTSLSCGMCLGFDSRDASNLSMSWD